MKTLAILSVVLTIAAVEASPPSLQDLSQLSREMTGLLDGYLEAVPECPPRPDTPIRIWQLDSAWLRANAVLGAVLDSSTTGPEVEWEGYFQACSGLMATYRRVLGAYHSGLPDSAAAVELEEDLLAACNLYTRRENRLLETLEEEVSE